MRHWSLPTRRLPLSVGVLTACALVTVETLILFPLSEVAAPVSLGVVYLLGVLLVSIVWGAPLGIATSLVSAVAFNFFHIPPTGRLTIAEAENWVALVVFLVVAAAASSLAEAARHRAQEAEQRGREADLAAELARVLLGAPDLSGALAPAAQRIAQAFDLASCRLVLEAVGDDERSAAIPLTDGEQRLGTLLGAQRGPAGRRARTARARGAARRGARARAADARGGRDARAAPLGRDQDRRAARGLARPALARSPRSSRPPRRSPRPRSRTTTGASSPPA